MKSTFCLLVIFIIATGCATPRLPKEEPSQLKLCLLGDVGKDTVAQDVVARALRQEKCHDIYFLGDIIYPNGLKDAEDKDFDVRFYRFYQVLTQTDHRPKLNILLGNHDYRGNPDAWINLAELHPEIHFPRRYYWKKIDNLCLIVLDSNAEDFEEQETWLIQQRENWVDCRYLIALAHHNLISKGPNYKTATPHVTNFYEKNILGFFDFLITGHEHVVEYVGEKKSTSLYISGAGGAVAKKHLPGYLTIEKMNKDSTALVVKIKTIERNGRVNIKSYTKELEISP